jgi:hypothetical protein
MSNKGKWWSEAKISCHLTMECEAAAESTRAQQCAAQARLAGPSSRHDNIQSALQADSRCHQELKCRKSEITNIQSPQSGDSGSVRLFGSNLLSLFN